MLPCGVGGAVIVAAWLVEAKQNVVENIAPVLTRVFTPLTIVMLLALLAGFAATRSIVDVDRNLLILMDLILVLVLGLLLYAISARDPQVPPDLFDRLQLLLVLSALAVDVLMLTAMLTRIAEFGVSPNKFVALGMNLVLLGTWPGRFGSGSHSSAVGAGSVRWNDGRPATCRCTAPGLRSWWWGCRRCSISREGRPLSALQALVQFGLHRHPRDVRHGLTRFRRDRIVDVGDQQVRGDVQCRASRKIIDRCGSALPSSRLTLRSMLEIWLRCTPDSSASCSWVRSRWVRNQRSRRPSARP